MANEILVVDDNSDIRQLISGILKDKGFMVREAANYDQALIEINKKLPDVAIIDVKLDKGDNDGIELLTYIKKIDDWNIDTKLSKEFETLGFFISDHPLNQYKTLFSQYNIISYEKFDNDDSIIRSNIACTVLKIQEKKTLKGNSYAIVKFSDLARVFELFVFSDIFESNREILIEGNSLMITLMKNFTDKNKVQKKINIKKIISLKVVINKPMEEIKIKVNNIDELNKFKSLSKNEGNTKILVQIEENEKIYSFQLNDKRKIDHKLINSLNIEDNIEIN